MYRFGAAICSLARAHHRVNMMLHGGAFFWPAQLNTDSEYRGLQSLLSR